MILNSTVTVLCEGGSLAKLAYYSTVPKKRSCIVEANTVSSLLLSVVCGVLHSHNFCVHNSPLSLFISNKGGGKFVCPCSFVCLSVSKIIQKRVHGVG